ncbi:hypothetical protein TWF506_011145 [Arthrobotrys conoides]|uniref:Uncharacterized protein n=1 Tax=Arthrobotrys conoides TaxID=74498 RepID=A0AAN8NA54_9PEZI
MLIHCVLCALAQPNTRNISTVTTPDSSFTSLQIVEPTFLLTPQLSFSSTSNSDIARTGIFTAPTKNTAAIPIRPAADTQNTVGPETDAIVIHTSASFEESKQIKKQNSSRKGKKRSGQQ